MAVSGGTRNPELRRLTLLYEFQKLKAWTPRGITPTDIDGRFLLHSGSGYNGGKGDFFLWLDLQTMGKLGSTAQTAAFEALLERGKGRDALIVATHAALQDPMHFPDDVLSFHVRMFDLGAKKVVQTRELTPGTNHVVGWWVQQWFAHCEERPNSFITAFRREAGLTPGALLRNAPYEAAPRVKQ